MIKEQHTAELFVQCGYMLETFWGDPSRAIEAYTTAITYDPLYVLGHLQLGYALYNTTNDFEGAEKSYRKALMIEPSNATAWLNLGVLLYQKRNDTAGALQAIEKAIELDPSDTEAKKHRRRIHNRCTRKISVHRDAIKEVGAIKKVGIE